MIQIPMIYAFKGTGWRSVNIGSGDSLLLLAITQIHVDQVHGTIWIQMHALLHNGFVIDIGRRRSKKYLWNYKAIIHISRIYVYVNIMCHNRILPREVRCAFKHRAYCGQHAIPAWKSRELWFPAPEWGVKLQTKQSNLARTTYGLYGFVDIDHVCCINSEL